MPAFKPFVLPVPTATFNSPSDFTATYLSRNTLTLSVLPATLTITNVAQIVFIRVIRAGGQDGVHYVNGSGMCAFAYAAGVLTVNGVENPFADGDAFSVGINGQSILSTIAENSGAIPVATHRSPVDFTAAFTSNITITLVGLPFPIVDNSQLVYIKQILAANTSKIWTNGKNCTLTEAGGVITIHGGGTPFVAADDYEVGINAQDKAYDSTQSADMVIEQAPVWDHFTGTVNLVNGTDIGAVNDTWVDQGSEIDMQTYTKLFLYIKLTVNDSTGNQLQVLSKHTSGGADEYPMEVSASYQKTLGNADMLMVYEFTVDNGIPYVQVQTKATLIGAVEGTVIIDVRKSWV
jgi:hypothetical protein